MGEPMDRTKSPFVSQTTFEGLFPNLEDVIVEGTVGESAYNRDPSDSACVSAVNRLSVK
jgi:hypothetical protein